MRKASRSFIDRFKRYRYFELMIIPQIMRCKFYHINGHQAGDEVLKLIVSQSRNMLQDIDLFGRIGGEEFALILTETDAETAMEVGERLRQKISKIQVTAEKEVIKFTVSIGLAMIENQADTLVTIMGRADSALYKAKENGRNCLVRA